MQEETGLQLNDSRGKTTDIPLSAHLLYEASTPWTGRDSIHARI